MESIKNSSLNISSDNDLQSKLAQARKDHQEVMQDRELLLKMLDRRTLAVERLENDVKLLKEQLKTAVESKCEAMIKFEEIQHRESTINLKEKRYQQEKLLLQSQIDMLTVDLDRNIQELQYHRKESTSRVLTLEGKLYEKSEELNVVVQQNQQLKETNSTLSTRIDELSEEIKRLNENFATTMKKYQQEVQAKTKLAELYKEKSEDSLCEQNDITAVITELRSALKEATDEYGVLETRLKKDQLKYQEELEELARIIKSQQNELNNANELLLSARQDNIEMAVEKLCPSAYKSLKLKGKSVTEIYTMYVNATEDLSNLTLEHEQLKHNFNEVIKEIEMRAPSIHKNQVELEKMKEGYTELKTQFDAVVRERIDTQSSIETMLKELNGSRKQVSDLKQEGKNLRSQVRHLLQFIENGRQSSGDNNDLSMFSSIEELQDNNMKLVALVRELSAGVEQIATDSSFVEKEIQTVENEQVKLKISEVKSIDNSEEKHKTLQDEFSNYKTKMEKALEELKKQLDDIKNQHHEVSAINLKLKAQIEHQDGQLKLQQKNFEGQKRKLQSLEDKNKNSASTLAKYETTIAHLQDEIKDYQVKLRNSETKMTKVLQKNNILAENEVQLRTENEVFQRQAQVQSMMMSNLEMIKSSVERLEKENGAKMQEKLEEMSAECEKLKKLLKESEIKYQEFEQQTNSLMEEMEEETSILRAELDRITQENSKKETKDEESQSDMEDQAEIAKLKEDNKNLRKIGKRYKEQYLELKSQLESSEHSKIFEDMMKENDELKEIIKKNENLKELLQKARSMITKLSEEKELLKEELSDTKQSSVVEESNGDLSKPGESKPTPEESKPTPEESKLTSEESKPTPEESKPTPEESKPTPEESESTPEESEPTPEESKLTPEESNQEEVTRESEVQSELKAVESQEYLTCPSQPEDTVIADATILSENTSMEDKSLKDNGKRPREEDFENEDDEVLIVEDKDTDDSGKDKRVKLDEVEEVQVISE